MKALTSQIPASLDGRRTLEVVAVHADLVTIREVDGGRETFLSPSIEDMREAARTHPEDHPYAALARQIDALIARRTAKQEAQERADAFARLRDCPGHAAVRESDAWGYSASVAVHPYTYENRAAHGNIGVTETCRCGSSRAVLVNGTHREYSPWRPTKRDGTVVWPTKRDGTAVRE